MNNLLKGYVLLEAENLLLLKRLQFNILPRKLNYVDYLVSFELFYRDIRNLWVLSAEDLHFIKTKTKSSLGTYNNSVPQNLSKGKFDALKEQI